MLPDDNKRYAIETCRSSESVLKNWFKINDIQLVHLLVVWWLVNLQDARCNNKDISGVSHSLHHGHKSTDQLNCFHVTMTATLWQVQPMTWHLCHLHVILSVINKRKYPFKHNTLMSYHTLTLNCCFGRHIFVCWRYRKTQRDSSDNRKVIFDGELLGAEGWTIPAAVWAEKTTEIVHIPSQEQPMCRFQFKAEAAYYNTQAVEDIVRMLDTLPLSPYQPPSMSSEVTPQTTVQAHILRIYRKGIW